jgi:hypothetical protein
MDMSSVLSLMVPEEILHCFNYDKRLEDNNSITRVMHEKPDLFLPFFQD